jgi:uncharacterized protein (TIRG00374 family)
MSAKRSLLVLGCALSAALLGVILWRLDWHDFTAGLRNLRYEWLAVGITLIVCSMALRTLRWRALAGLAHVPFRAFWNAATMGLFINQVYPLRAGEIFRMFAIRHLAQVPLGRAAMSALVDRVADVLMLGVCALAVFSTHTGLAHAGRLAGTALVTVVAVIAGLLAFARGDRLWRRWIAAWSARMSGRLQERIEGFYSEALATAALLGSPERVGSVLLLTAGAFLLDFAVVQCALKAFGWDLPLIAPATVLVFLAIGVSLPSAPGYAGVYQIACIFALALFGITESQAVAFSLVLQMCVLLTVLVLAGWVALGHLDAFRGARGAMSALKESDRVG